MTDIPMHALGSISRLLGGLRAGDEDAVRQLWHRYFTPLVRLARGRLLSSAVRDAEDVALDAFWSLCRQAAEEDFPQLHNREHLWRLLACFTARQACDWSRKEARRRRVLETESVVGENALANIAGREPPPEFAAAVADLLECLPSDELRTIAVARMEGRTNDEVARQLGRSLSTIERKLQVIRVLWQDIEEHRP